MRELNASPFPSIVFTDMEPPLGSQVDDDDIIKRTFMERMRVLAKMVLASHGVQRMEMWCWNLYCGARSC